MPKWRTFHKNSDLKIVRDDITKNNKDKNTKTYWGGKWYIDFKTASKAVKNWRLTEEQNIFSSR